VAAAAALCWLRCRQRLGLWQQQRQWQQQQQLQRQQ